MKKKCWLAREVEGGWKLTLEAGKYSFRPTPDRIFKTYASIDKFVNSFGFDLNIVFVHKAKSKFKPR